MDKLFLSGYMTNFGYNLVEITNAYGFKFYMSYFPPALSSTKTPFVTDEDLPMVPIPDVSYLPSVESMKSFWVSDDEIQCDGRYKGGSWGYNNFPPSNTNWIIGADLLDEIIVHDFIPGIIPFGVFMNNKSLGDKIFTDSEPMAFSVLFDFNGKTFHGYIFEHPMNQHAIDAMVVYKSNDIYYARCARRNVKSGNVDIPLKLIPGSGETVEPTEGGFAVKGQLRKAIREELALSGDFADSNVYYIGTFDAVGRDPRYDTYSVIERRKMKTFGLPRLSITKLYLILFNSEDDTIPETILDDVDHAEISKTFWIELDKLCEIAPREFMVPEHGSYPILIRDYIASLQV